jgi:hypothetical protein
MGYARCLDLGSQQVQCFHEKGRGGTVEYISLGRADFHETTMIFIYLPSKDMLHPIESSLYTV